MPPLETQVFAGNQVSRARAEGIEFADLREWQPGDAVRRVNWRATALRGELWVNEQHPERNTDVVLFLDTFAEVRAQGRSTNDRAVRAAATLAHGYLQRKDRVGLVGFGGVLSWLVPESGTRQLYAIVDTLLDERHRAQLRVARRRRAAAADAPGEGPRARAHAAAGRPDGRGTARPARPRLRPDRGRGLSARAARTGPGLAPGARPPPLAPLARGAALALRAGRRARRQLARGSPARRRARGGERIQAPRQARVAFAAAALAAYGGVLALALARAGSTAEALAPGAILGTVLLAAALVRGGGTLGLALFLGGATYVSFLVAEHGQVDATAPLVATLLLLCGELSAWSLDERWEIRADDALAWRRGAALGILALAGLAVSALLVALSAVPSSHGLAWTVAGAAAAVGAAGTGVWVARR